MAEEAKWYVAHTYSGYENKVEKDLKKTIANNHLEDQILEVMIPVEEVTEIRNGKKKTMVRKLFPGYVLVNMIMNDRTWYIVRNIRGVTGFVGPGSKPVALTEAEMKTLGVGVGRILVGDSVIIVADPWIDKVGTVVKVDYDRDSATVNLDIFGRETPVEIDLESLRKLN